MTYTVTVDVHDLEPTGPVPPGAELRIARLQPDGSGGQVVSTRQHSIPVGTGPVTFTATPGVAYEAQFVGVKGWEAVFYFVGTTDTTIAELWRNHQVDPGNLTTAPVPQSVTTTIAAVAAAAAQKSANLSDLTSASAARTALGLGSAATHPATDFDPAGSAAAVTLAGLGGITPTAVDTKVSTALTALVGAAPQALDTLAEIDAQIASDEGSAAALSALVATKVSVTDHGDGTATLA